MIHIIAIEGLDGSGKTYITAKLEEMLKKEHGEDIIIMNEHFPVDITVVEAANNIMSHEPTFNDYMNIVELFAHDRKLWYKNLCKTHKRNSKDVLVLADRFIVSNALYNVPAIINALAADRTDYEKKVLAGFLAETILAFDNSTPKPCGTIMMDIRHGVRSRRLAERKKLDLYEAKEMVASQEQFMTEVMHVSKKHGFLGELYNCRTVPDEKATDELYKFIVNTVGAYSAAFDNRR